MKQHLSKRRRKVKPLHRKLKPVFNIVFAVVFILCDAAVAFGCIILFSRTLPVLGIIIAASLSALLAVPVTLLLLPLLKPLIKASEDEKDAALAEQREHIEQLEKENAEYSENEENYERRIALLENLTFNMETYQDVFKVCLRDYQKTGAIKQREVFNEEDYANVIKRMLKQPSKNYDEVICIMDTMVKYQRGVDLQKVRIAKVNNHTVIVTGIKPEYITPPRFEYKDFFSEFRHVKLDKNGNKQHVTLENDAYSKIVLERKQNEYKTIFEDSFMNGDKQEEDSDELIQRAEDFIKILLEPVYRHVEFERAELLSSTLPLLDFLHAEIDDCALHLEEQSKSKIIQPKEA